MIIIVSEVIKMNILVSKKIILTIAISLLLLQCSNNNKSKSDNLSLLYPLALTGGEEIQETEGYKGENTVEQQQPDIVELYLKNIRSGVYQIKPRGKTTSSLTVKIKSSNLEESETSTKSYTRKANKPNNDNNGPQQEGDIDELWINIKEIQFVSDNGNKITVPSALSSVDLLKLKDDATILFSKAIVPEGQYDQIRLILNEPNGKVVKDGVEHSLKVPSGSQTGLKLNGEIDLVSGLLLEFTLNFQLSSLKYTPGKGYILRPTVPIENIKTLLPFLHGMLIVKFKSQVTVSTNPEGSPTTGIASIDDIISKYNRIVIEKFIDDLPNIDMEVATKVGLDRVYLFYFRQDQEVLLPMFDLFQNVSIERVSPNHFMDLAETIPNDPEADRNCGTCSKNQTNYLTAINAYNGWDITTGNRDIRIAVVDTGVDDQHPDLVGRITQNRSFFWGTCYDFGNPYSCIEHRDNSRPIPSPKASHGTHVAGIIGALSNNNTGVAGIN